MKIAFTGDLAFSKYFKDAHNREDLLSGEVIDYLADTDYTVVNVEGCISDAKPSAGKPLVHANSTECMGFMKKINGNVFTLANNHITDCGREGVESTLNVAAAHGVATVGIGLNMGQTEKPLIIENDGA